MASIHISEILRLNTSKRYFLSLNSVFLHKKSCSNRTHPTAFSPSVTVCLSLGAPSLKTTPHYKESGRDDQVQCSKEYLDL
ncbi:hypothetical protein OUZ56_021984 [Daphnia magna]|uniref:Uncharacterized protein n=1 Tax=Daphnia magna TaxID=35525 RepID=A0ABR0AV08_9CRUS|nr:hypothetical protein OUZ56_021984 [Daphnia magna]